MKARFKFGYVLIGLIIGIVAAQALPLFAHGTFGPMMGHGWGHGMGGHHIHAMHDMMGPHGNCPLLGTEEMLPHVGKTSTFIHY